MPSVEKVIHQTWKVSDLPEPYLTYADSVKLHNPGYQYRLWTDADNRALIASRFSWFLETYDSYTHPIERVDAARYFILYEFGGVYIDLDMECFKSFDTLFDQDDCCWFSLEAGPSIENKVVSNAFMAAPKGHPLFADLVRKLLTIKGRDITFKDVFNNTGPDMLQRFLFKSLGQYTFKLIGLERICPIGVLKQLDIYSQLSHDDICTHDALIFLHHNTESWNVQHRWPGVELPGYTIFEHHDILGKDIAYIAGDIQQIVDASNAREDVIGFNYNGFLKGEGGQLTEMGQANSWLKKGNIAWVCVKNQYLGAI